MNANPLIPLDGYFALSDYLEVPNLRQRAFAHLPGLVQAKVFRLDVPLPPADEREQRIFLIYGLLAAWLHRVDLAAGRRLASTAGSTARSARLGIALFVAGRLAHGAATPSAHWAGTAAAAWREVRAPAWPRRPPRPDAARGGTASSWPARSSPGRSR